MGGESSSEGEGEGEGGESSSESEGESESAGEAAEAESESKLSKMEDKVKSLSKKLADIQGEKDESEAAEEEEELTSNMEKNKAKSKKKKLNLWQRVKKIEETHKNATKNEGAVEGHEREGEEEEADPHAKKMHKALKKLEPKTLEQRIKMLKARKMQGGGKLNPPTGGKQDIPSMELPKEGEATKSR